MLVGLDLPSVGGGVEAGVRFPHWGNCLVRGETLKAESEAADLWPPKWNEDQQSLLQPYILWTGYRAPGRCSSWELESRHCGEIPGRGLLLTSERCIERMGARRSWKMPVEEIPAAREARLSHAWGRSRHHSLSLHMPASAAQR